MAVPAIELKPRGAVALFDSAIRLCARTGGVWALTLPGGAVVTWAVLRMAEAIQAGAALAIPAALVALAWVLRGFTQAAACHYLDEQLVGQSPPSAWRSLRAALAKAPSVIITAAYLPLFSFFTLTLSGGIAWFLLPSHIAGWAAVMKGKGSPLSLYGTCSRMLGPARSHAAAIRLLFLAIVLFGLNLHVAVNALVFLGRKLAALELTYVQRFVSFDNGSWVLVLIALSFTAFEPLRAAVATLMLIDGRVRQEGLDLLAAVEQLPERPSRRASAAMVVLALVGGLLVAAPAHAQEAAPTSRLKDAAAECEYQNPRLASLPNPAQLSEAERAALSRLADDAEYFAWEWENCDALARRLDAALPLLEEAAAASGPQSTVNASDKARAILARPEFAVAPTAPEAAPAEDADSLWSRLSKWWKDLLDRLSKQRPHDAPHAPPTGAGMGAARLVTVLLVLAAIVVLGGLLVMAFRGKRDEQAVLDVVAEGTQLSPDATGENALARPPEGWAHLADELAAKGEFREAVRSLYLALLSRLHRTGAINYDPALSNWDYCRQFRGQREWVRAFRDLTNRFDFAWYGQTNVSPEAYAEFRSLTEPMLAGGGANA